MRQRGIACISSFAYAGHFVEHEANELLMLPRILKVHPKQVNGVQEKWITVYL